MALAAFQHVRKSFTVDGRAFEAIRDFSLEIEEGEVVAIVGGSGCGKSTLLRLLSGLDTDYSGEILMDGQRVSGIDGSCGLVFQEHRLFPWLSVAGNIGLGLINEALTNAVKRERIAEQIDLVGLSGFESALPHQLSGGMAQRVAIARGLVGRPRLLMLDEPFGALDAITRRQMQDELIRIQGSRKVTTLIVTHDVEEAVTLADRIAVMQPRPGTLREVVTVDLPRPRQRSSAEFHHIVDRTLDLLGLQSTLPEPHQ